jgi:ABC-type lipoprotein release transport system permease subunit
MKFLLTLAFKNLWRYKRRTLITAGALAAGIALYIYTDAFLLGLEKESERNIIWYQTGSAKVLNREALTKKTEFLSLKYLIEQPAQAEQVVQRFIYPYTKRTVFPGELFFGEGYLPVQGIGIDRITDERVFRLQEYIVEGDYFGKEAAGAEAYEAIIGVRLAQDLKARVGDLVTLRTRTRYGGWQTLDLSIRGLINSPNPVINDGTIFLPLEITDEALQMEGAVTELPVIFPEWLDPAQEISNLKAAIETELPALTVQTWQELSEGYVALSQSKTVSSRLILILIFIIAAVGISNTMLMAVFERVKEIGMMRALGMADGRILLTLIIEAGGIGLIGSFFGLIIGTILTYFTVKYGIDFSGIYGNMDIGYPIAGVFRAAWHPEAMVNALFIGIIMCMLIALIPARRALKMEITNALRYN